MARSLLVAGLAFGDESKGATVDALCREFPVDLVIRYNGGCQAQHAVVLPDGTTHTFSQFGAGMLANEQVCTYLSRYVLVEPLAMLREASALQPLIPDIWDRVSVDARAPIVTPLHRQLNRLRERARGDQRHGSCGRGIGVTRELHLLYGSDVLVAGDFRDKSRLAEKVAFLWETMRAESQALSISLRERWRDLTNADDVIALYENLDWPVRIVDGFEPAPLMVFEGAQGVLLDETHGFQPHVTWTDTTFTNADALLDSVGVTDVVRIGCLRSYYTRHGAGPFPTEDSTLAVPELHNGTGEYQGAFRVGRFDFNLARRALKIVGGVDALSISHLDYLDRLGIGNETDFLEAIESSLGIEIGMTAHGPTANDRQIRNGILKMECTA
ncbi:MAG TPA: adenylosuccinate synthetase [Candidatus Acidoferrales bacterium]|nr:adenylosuccinate synthetase [Candidatus Acidoferrales bacterium]